MKACIIQPAYSTDYDKSDEYFDAQLALLAQCDESMDLIVLPECCDIPCLANTKEKRENSSAKFKDRILQAAMDTAKRCHAMVFLNVRYQGETAHRNTTYAINRVGEIVGHYHKQHLTPGETSLASGLESDYSLDFEEPTVIEMEGIRFGFLTCYDFYFYEAFPNLARQKLDVIIGCSHQRSDTHAALEIITQFLAYHTNAYVVRSSVSMDENSDIGGASMIVAPTGKILCNLRSEVGLATATFDVGEKYYKPAGFGNPIAAHYEYIEQGRRPWKYRPAGSAIVRYDAVMPYPRTCAHRGFNTVAPENSMPAFGAAVAMGADEIEFDLWQTKDGKIVSCHDCNLDRVSDGTGFVTDYTLKELQKFDFGVKFSDAYKGLRIVTFEEILKKFACHTVMNIHIKGPDTTHPLDEQYLRDIIAMIDKYDCRKHVYFMTGNDTVITQLQALAPDICCCLGGGDDYWGIVDRAIKLGCKKVQLVKGAFNKEMIEKAHENGIICNVFWSDNPAETQEFLDMGCDVILTNDYNTISQVVNAREKHRAQ